jgi:hypothetical protein
VPFVGPLGLPSEKWGTISNAINIYKGGFNEYAWQNCRAYQSNSIVNSGPAQNRDLQAAMMFRSLGQVMHLVQDAAQPQHARNEQHLDMIGIFDTPWRSSFEDWGLHNLKLIAFTPQDFDWMGAGFTCVSNFWDTGLYNPTVTGTTPLDENESGTITLGLAEYCNGNFLTVRGVYGDLLTSLGANLSPSLGVSQDHYPISQSTDLAEVESNPSAFARGVYLANYIPQQTVYRCYVDKTSQGAVVRPHSSLDLLGAFYPGSSYGQIAPGFWIIISVGDWLFGPARLRTRPVTSPLKIFLPWTWMGALLECLPMIFRAIAPRLRT